MATKRDHFVPLRKSYPLSERVNSVSLGAETMFTRLLALCDDQSAYDADPHLLLCALFAHRWKAGQVTIEDMTAWLAELVAAGLVEPYANGKYLVIVNGLRCTRPDVKPDIRYPKPTQGRNECGPNAARMRPPKQNKTNLNKPKQTTTSAAFAAFWDSWPSHFRKRARGRCWAKWKSKNLDAHAARIMAVLDAEKRGDQWKDPQYIPAPIAWLNQEKYDVDPEQLARDAPKPEETMEQRMARIRREEAQRVKP